MSSSKDKWKLGIQLHKRASSNLSQGSIASLETNPAEVDIYLSKLKGKTGVRRIWSGHKFDDFVEGDQTPDVSLSSDEALNIQLNKMSLKGFSGINLDSDEDEMRIDYMRESKEVGNPLSAKSIGSEVSVNLMENIHFAELDMADILLSDTQKTEEVNDFLPHAYTVIDLEKDGYSSRKLESSEDQNFGHNVKYQTSTSNTKNCDKYSTPSNSKIFDSQIDSNISKSTNYEDISENIHSESRSNVSTSEIRSSVKSNSKSKSFLNKESPTLNSKRCISSNTSYTSKSRATSKNSSISRYSHVQNHEINLPLTSDVELANEASSTILSELDDYSSNDFSSKGNDCKSKSSAKRSRLKSKRTEKQTKDQATQISHKPVPQNDMTANVLNFRHTWQFPQVSSITSKFVDPYSIDILSSSNPATLALNDMLKFHVHLLRNHIDHSRRLYEAYANEDFNSNYKYETLQNTMEYIKQNRPKVITYKQALKNVQEHGF